MKIMHRNRIENPIVFIDDAHTFGGAQIALAWSVRAILRNTDERIVCVCTPKTTQAIQEIVGEQQRLEFQECPSALPLNVFSFPLRLIAFHRIVVRLRRKGVRVWWLNLSGVEFCLAPLCILKALGEVPRAWLHNTERFAFFNQHARWTRRCLSSIRDRIADRWLFGIYPRLITPSKSTATDVEARMRGTIRQVAGYLYYPPIGEPPASRPVLGAADNGPVDGPIDLWMIGRIEYGHKNNLAALDVLTKLSAAGKAVTLTVVGDGPDMADFQKRSAALGAAHRINFLGWRKDPWQSVPFGATVFIPSFYESMSLVAREAMIRGIRLATSPIPVFQEWIPDRFLAADFSPQEFVAKIVEVQNIDRHDLLTLYAKALARFSDAIFVERFLSYSR